MDAVVGCLEDVRLTDRKKQKLRMAGVEQYGKFKSKQGMNTMGRITGDIGVI